MLLTALLLLLLGDAHAGRPIFVQPERAGQSNVRAFDFDWQELDLFAGPNTEGLRLYFYERERPAAGEAAAILADSLTRLERPFGGPAPDRYAFVLYSSYQEFLRTNLFPLSEGILGVTSTRRALVTVPWLGDPRRFRDVATHELAHELTIQKVRRATKGADTDALARMPLWFVEGLAEHYAHDGLDDEARMVALDLAVSPDLDQGVGVYPFYEDHPWDVRWTYAMGHVRCAFLEATYGEGTIQRLLAASPRLTQRRFTRDAFPELVEDVTGDDAAAIDAKFAAWTREQAYPTWLAAAQHTIAVDEDLGTPHALDASDDGTVLMLRGIDRERGLTRLWLVDPRFPTDRRTVAIDGRPGVESLHPTSERSFDLGDATLVYVAEARGRDVLVSRRWSREVRRSPPQADPDTAATPVRWRLGPEVRHALPGLVGAFAPSLGPDGRVAFVGLDPTGQRDVYVLDPTTGDVGQITHDRHAERETAWAGSEVLYTSDATADGRFDLFRAAPGAAPTRVTDAPFDVANPVVDAAGRVFFTGWADGRSQIYEADAGRVQARTDVATGLFDAARGPDGHLWALLYRGGAQHPARVPIRAPFGDPHDAPPAADAPAPAVLPLDVAAPYRTFAARNWRIAGAYGFLSAGAGGVYGQVVAVASDVLNDESAVIDVAMYGRPAYTNGYVALIDQRHRVTWGAGPFHFLRWRFEQADGVTFVSNERFYGALGSVRYPLDRFVYVQADASVGGSADFLSASTAAWLQDGALNGQGDLYTDWAAHRLGTAPQAELSGAVGVDTVGYHVRTGPYQGSSALVGATVGARPGELYGSARADLATFVPIADAANVSVFGGAGASFGERAQGFYLSNPDTLRGVPNSDPSWLIGRTYAFGTVELQVPLDAVVRIPFASTLEGVAAVDAGATADTVDGLWDRRIVDGVLGVNLIIGPMVMRFHFAHPFDVGAPLPTTAPWVTQISLAWLY